MVAFEVIISESTQVTSGCECNRFCGLVRVGLHVCWDSLIVAGSICASGMMLFMKRRSIIPLSVSGVCFRCGRRNDIMRRIERSLRFPVMVVSYR